jgi:hypothetical protein
VTRTGALLLAALAAAIVLALGSQPAAGSTIAVLDRFAITRDGQPFFADAFSGEQASVLTPRLAGGQRTEYSVMGTIRDRSAATGRFSLHSADGSLSATADGRGRRQVGAMLQTSSDSGNTRAGLKRGIAFAMSGLFDFVVPGGAVEGYGIRFGDIGSGRKAMHVVSIFVFRNEANGPVIRFLHQDFESGKQYVVEDAPTEGEAGDQILLELSHGDRQSNDVTARYQFWKSGAPAASLVSLRGSAPIFGAGDRNWTRAGFFAFEQATAK